MLDAHSTVFLYDGSFEGFLTTVFESTRLQLKPKEIVAEDRYAPGLFDDPRIVASCTAHADRVWEHLQKLAGQSRANMVRAAFLSETPGIELDIWQYLKKLSADTTGQFAENILDDHAYRLYQMANKVRHEAHLLTGFVRFQTTQQGTLFAAIEPVYNVVDLLAPHFRNRFPNQDWLIVDARRGSAIHYAQGDLRSVHMSPHELPLTAGSLRSELLDENEERFRDLWKAYHGAITIPERKNLRLRNRLLPRKYWKYLTEMMG